MMIIKIKRVGQSACILPILGTSQKVILTVFSCFFQDLFDFVINCNKRHIFLCLFVLFAHYITGLDTNGCPIVRGN